MILQDMYLDYVFYVLMILYFKLSKYWASILQKYLGEGKNSEGPILVHIPVPLRDI